MNRCFACDRKLGKNPHHVSTIDKQSVVVGSECFKQIIPMIGWQPTKGGPRLYRALFTVDGFVWKVKELK